MGWNIFKNIGGGVWIFSGLCFIQLHSLDNVMQGQLSGKKSDTLHIGGTAVPVLQDPLKDALLC